MSADGHRAEDEEVAASILSLLRRGPPKPWPGAPVPNVGDKRTLPTKQN